MGLFWNIIPKEENTYTSSTIQSQNVEQIAKIYQKIKDYINQPAIQQDNERPVDQEMFGEMIRIVLSNLNNQQIIENYKAKLTTSQIIVIYLQSIDIQSIVNNIPQFQEKQRRINQILYQKCFQIFRRESQQVTNHQYIENLKKKHMKHAFNNTLEIMDFIYLTSKNMYVIRKYQTSFKSMNSQFLRMLFKSPNFAVDFEEFLSNFKKYAMIQNERKIALLIDQIQFPLKDELNLGKIRRIPWPIDVINQSINIGSNLLNFSDLVPKSQKNSSQTDEI
ncbi:hypothetical protein pb186bvf_000619 [Paramecium bursaria]